MNDRLTFLPRVYTPPRVADYGTLADLTADGGMLMPFGVAGVSMPLVPNPEPPGGPDFGPPGGSSSVPGGDVAGSGDLGGGGPGSVAGESFPGGAGGEGGGGAGGVVSTGGGDASLPFTGFPAAVAAAIGAGLAGAGAAMRRALRRD